MSRVVVTGLGLVTPLGCGVSKVWDRIVNSDSGIVQIPQSMCNTEDLKCKIAGVISESDYSYITSHKHVDSRKMDRFIEFSLVAADEAIKDAGFSDLSQKTKDNIGVIVGSGIGGLCKIEENALLLKSKGPRAISPFFIPASLVNLASGHISIAHGYRGINFSVVSACSTGAHAIGEAFNNIRSGKTNIMIAGGTEGAVCRLGIAGFSAARALATKFNDNPKDASRPWDKERDGFVMGEGAGVVVLEEFEHAKKRNANIYAEIIGYGATSDAYHITSPELNGLGAIKTMHNTLTDANISPNKIDYINAHGTSTKLGDSVEINAINKIYGENIKNIAISSTKSAIGHLLGAAGSVEAILTVLSIKNNIAPPTLNLHEPDAVCQGINLVPITSQEKQINYAMSNSFGFGGTNASLIMKKI